VSTILQAKSAFENQFPHAYRFVRKRLPRSVLFKLIYHSNYWGNSHSRSGPGSDLDSTAAVRGALPQLLRDLEVHSLLDAACGDFHWMSQLSLPVDEYVGVDIVPAMIRRNNAEFGNATRRFICLDFCKDMLPRVDAILAREVLVHLSYADIFKALRNFRQSGAKYLIATTHHNFESNTDIATCQWRPLNFQLAPFNLPEPIALVDERRDTEAGGMSLGVWRLESVAV
jgi:SAM-dependent methyltransferase